MQKANIVLIGMSGCGKTAVGTRVADTLGFNYTDTDTDIENKAGMSVTKIFERFGEEHFRQLEAEIINEAAHKINAVISTGGGCVKNEDNMQALAENGVIIYLKCSPEKIYSNIKDDTSRPLLQTDDKLKSIADLLLQRTFLYERYAQTVIDVTNLTVDEAAKSVYEAAKLF